jgi:Right handed beta helix region
MIETTRLLLAVALMSVLLPAGPTQAQLARTFVSAAGGNDANNCDRATPCRTFQGAHDKTLANGEITVLDPGGYGAVTITKTISIINDGVGEAGMLVSGGANGVTIDAGATDAISLRGLTIKGIGFGGGNGIWFNTGRSLTVENCVIRNLSQTGNLGFGIVFHPAASSSLAVSNTLLAENANMGIFVWPGSGTGTVMATFSRVEVYNSGTFGIAIHVIGPSALPVRATVVDSVIASNGNDGLRLLASMVSSNMMVARSTIANNGLGLGVGSGQAIMRIRQSIVTGNTVSWSASAGALLSYGDNSIDGNSDGNPAPPVIGMK